MCDLLRRATQTNPRETGDAFRWTGSNENMRVQSETELHTIAVSMRLIFFYLRVFVFRSLVFIYLISTFLA